MATNYEKLLQNIGQEKKPFIVCDVETTGLMNGNDNKVTQIALASYDYNKKTGQYELQDKIFMLRKAEKEVLENIEKNEVPNRDNAEQRLYEEYKYNIVKEIKSVEKKRSQAESKGDAHNESLYAGQLQTLWEKKNYFDNIPSYNELKRLEQTISNPIARGFLDHAISEIIVRVDDKVAEMEKADKLDKILALQGIKLEEYRKCKEGLTDSELAIGVTNFLKKYQKDDTVFVNNGAYSTAHYLEKSGIVIGNKDNTIDLTQAERSMHGGKSEWTADVSRFAENYTKDTGNEIKFFDAFTKALCMGEMTVSACDLSLVNTSEKYLENMVKEQAQSRDEDYVMSQSRALSLDWIPASSREYDYADYHFDSLEYVDFGNDRRYVDIDKMFEVNDNFEVTLEGEKTPIKTWEELEAKIKALNSDISKELLEQIHEKYIEISDKAIEQKTEKAEKENEVGEITPENRNRLEKVKEQEEKRLSADEIFEMKEKELLSLINTCKETKEQTDVLREQLKNRQAEVMQKGFDKVRPIFERMMTLANTLRNAGYPLGAVEFKIKESSSLLTASKHHYVISENTKFFNENKNYNENKNWMQIMNKDTGKTIVYVDGKLNTVKDGHLYTLDSIEDLKELLKILPVARDNFYEQATDKINEKIEIQTNAKSSIQNSLDSYDEMEKMIDETDLDR